MVDVPHAPEGGSEIPVHDGLFVTGDPPRLVGGLCASCGRHSFPRRDSCPYCGDDTVRALELSSTGRLWAWTAVTSAPPGYDSELPYGFGVVELPEGLRVISRLTEADPDLLAAGQLMHLVTVPLHDDEGRRVVTYAFAPGEAP